MQSSTYSRFLTTKLMSKITTVLSLCVLVLYSLSSISAQCTHPDYNALMALYNSTDGPNWSDNTGWSEGASGSSCDPCDYNGGTWYGINCFNGRVKFLFIDGNGLSGQLPSELQELTNLRGITIENDDLSGPIPPSLARVESLVQIALRNNNLSGGIPQEFSNSSLEILDLSYNRNLGLSVIPIITNLKLLYLTGIGYNGAFPNIFDMKNLEFLELSDNMILGGLPNRIGELTNLKKFEFWNTFSTGPLPESLGELENLNLLLLTGNNFSGCIPESYSRFCSITFSLERNNLLPWNGNTNKFCENPNGQIGSPCGSEGMMINSDCTCAHPDNDNDGYTQDKDCDDTNPNINPGVSETCDGIDNNCDGNIDENIPDYLPPQLFCTDTISNELGLSWQENNTVSSYNIYIGSNLVGTSLDTIYRIDNLVPGQRYNITVEAIFNDQSLGCASLSSSITCETPSSNECICNFDGSFEVITKISESTDTLWNQYIGATSTVLYDFILDQDGSGYHPAFGLGNDTITDFSFGSYNILYQEPDYPAGNLSFIANCDAFEITGQSQSGHSYNVSNPIISNAELSFEWTSTKGEAGYTQLRRSDGLSWYCPRVIDNDGDGYGTEVDCDDSDPNINPASVELCDNFDNNCDGIIDEGFEGHLAPAPACLDAGPDFITISWDEINDISTFFIYVDGNYIGATQMSSYTLTGLADQQEYVVRVEAVFNNGCENLTTNISCFTSAYADNDNDGYNEIDDCDDSNAAINPAAIEIPNNDIDENCDGVILIIDDDNDGFNSDEDCDDSNATVFPGATESCDDVDNNCNGVIDEGFEGHVAPAPTCVNVGPDFITIEWDGINDISTFFIYQDGNYQGSAQTSTYMLTGLQPLQEYMIIVEAVFNNGCENLRTDITCTTGSFSDNDGDGSTSNEDCNDNDATIYPGAEEICDGKDNDCNGSIDDGLTFLEYYLDEDGDGFGQDDSVFPDCMQSQGYVLEPGDCDDTDSSVFPGAEELCDGKDNNCDNQIDEGLSFTDYYIDEDGDGYGQDDFFASFCDEPVGYAIESGDCDDTDPAINPGAIEILNNDIDEDCDGQANTTATHELEGQVIDIYPNPVTDLLYIKTDLEKLTYKLSTLTGQVLKSGVLTSDPIDLTDMQIGLYLLSINSDSGKESIVERVIKL